MPETARITRIEAEIPYGLFEYTALFEKPILEALGGSVVPVIAAVLDALGPWGFKVDGVEVKRSPEKLIEHGVVFRRTSPPTPAMSLALSFNRIFISAENLDWSEADNFMAAMRAGVDAIQRTANPKIQSQHVALGMHIQLKMKPRNEVTAPLLGESARRLLDGDVRFSGIILNREKCSVIIDASAAYANGLFVRMFREHPPAVTWTHLAEALRKDEEQLFEVLGLQGTL
jgi:hypothetical protein